MLENGNSPIKVKKKTMTKKMKKNVRGKSQGQESGPMAVMLPDWGGHMVTPPANPEDHTAKKLPESFSYPTL